MSVSESEPPEGEAAFANNGILKVAAVQASPIFLDRAATVEKACGLIADAARAGARLIVFPEAFIPAYPDWVWLPLPPGESGTAHNELYAELLEQAVTIPGETTERLGEAAREAGAYIVIGVNERNVEASGGSLYNTLLYIGPDGTILGKHRKLVPTAGERLIWTPGDGGTLAVYDTPFGRLSGLICWENYMPLARYALYAWGTQIYVAATWDCSDVWLSTLRHIAKEGRMFVIGCCTAMRNADIPDRLSIKQPFYADPEEWVNLGNSAILGPSGDFLVGPVSKKEEILYADLNLRELRTAKRLLDVAGHYARPDIFGFTVNTGAHAPILEASAK
jgi:nitrilase